MQIPIWPSLDQLFRQYRFANLMALYEANYQRLLELAADLREPARIVHQRQLERQLQGQSAAAEAGRAADDAVISHDVWAQVEGLPDLHMQCVLCHRFTTDLRLTHYFPDACDDAVNGGAAGSVDVTPDLTIRIYHDSGQAEIWPPEWQPPENPQRAGDNLLAQFSSRDGGFGDGNLRQRWEANLFLERWLRFCLQRGYRFQRLLGARPASSDFVDAGLSRGDDKLKTYADAV